MSKYPLTDWHIEHGMGGYIKSLRESISRQMETKRYYQQKFQNITLPPITADDVSLEVERALEEQPKQFAKDMKFLSEQCKTKHACTL